jgi:hypothetical protein
MADQDTLTLTSDPCGPDLARMQKRLMAAQVRSLGLEAEVKRLRVALGFARAGYYAQADALLDGVVPLVPAVG